MAFVSLKDLARSPMTVELYVNHNNCLCVRCADEYGAVNYEVVEFEGNQGADLDYPLNY